RTVFALVNDAVDAVALATRAGTAFVFGYLGGGPLPFEPKTPGSEFILAFQALPTALVMSVLTTLLFYWRILPPIIRGSPGCSNARSASVGRSGSRLQRTSSWVWWKRPCSSAPTSTGCRAASCSS